MTAYTGINRLSITPTRGCLAVLLIGLAASGARAECALLHETFGDLLSIIGNGGDVTGPVEFRPGINGGAAEFAGSAWITYPGAMFNASNASLSMWLKKKSADPAGGICEIGTLGQANSMGLFYINDTDLLMEMRGSNGALVQVTVNAALSQVDWTHVVAMWAPGSGGQNLWLFINGRFAGYGYLPGIVALNAGLLRMGTTGYYGNAEVLIDELRFFDWPLHDGEVYAEMVYSANRFVRQSTAKPVSTGTVRLVDGALRVAERPYRVKSVGYAPTPIGSWPGAAQYNNPQIIARDIALLRGMNVNTIRLWAQPPDTALLNACYNGGVDPIRVIVGYWVPLHQGTDYADPATTAAIEADFRQFINQFKTHPAVLAWGIGNENNFAYQGNVADWYALAERLARAAYEEEGAAYHPAIVVNGDLQQLGDVAVGSDDASLPHVDIWGHNVYFGYDAHCYFDYYRRVTAKPMIVTEFGIDAWDQAAGQTHPAVQAEWVVQQWRQIKANALGGSVMAYVDEWWKAGVPGQQDFGGYVTRQHPDGYSNEEWWGMLSASDNGSGPDVLQPRPVYHALAADFADRVGDHDEDDHVDLHDLAAFQRCLGSAGDPNCAAAFDFLVDGTIDLNDHASLTDCLAGPNQPPACPE